VNTQTVVVGAGVAGLTIASRLAREGRRVTLVERDAWAGGLARTWHYGDFHFDVGPHRFHTDNRRVEQFVREVLGSQAIEISRSSGARMFGRFHPWPLRPSVFLSMPPSVMLRGAIDAVARRRVPGESFEADVLNKYGRTLYEIFFRPYTRKFLGSDPADLHRDWGRAGVNRAVIDKRASADTIWSLIRTTLLPKPVETTFLYSPRGIGQFSDRLVSAIRDCGGRVLLGRRVTALTLRDGRITAVAAGGEEIACDDVVWTGPITEAAALAGIGPVRLEFLSTLFYNFEIGVPPRVPYQWTYFGGDEIFSRASSPTAFDRGMAPDGMSGLCVEVTCREGDERWGRPEALVDGIVRDLARTGMIGSPDDVRGLHIEPVRNTYPIYGLDYPAELASCLRALGGVRNLLLAGRCGRFWYNNMDHSIGQGLTMADRILRGEALAGIDAGPRDFWEEPPGSAPAGD